MKRIIRRSKSTRRDARPVECPQSAKAELAAVVWLHPSLLLTRVA